MDGISGFFEIDHDLHAPGQHDDWYGVEIIWNQNKGAFTWQNRAGVTWTLTPLMGSSGDWDESKLAVGNDCPYKNDGHEFAMIEWVSSVLLCIFNVPGLNFSLKIMIRALWKALKLSQPFGDLGMSPTLETCKEHPLSLTAITTLLLPLPTNVCTSL